MTTDINNASFHSPIPPRGSGPSTRPIVLVGMMGAGKSCIGRRIAPLLKMDFVDVDRAIEEAAGCTIPEIFDRHGEAAFRDGERRVLARLLNGPAAVLATGGGAFMDMGTRGLIHEKAISIWLRAELDVLWRRVSRRQDRPLLKVEDPRARLEQLMQERYPIYAEADIIVDSADVSAEVVAEKVMAALGDYQARSSS